MYKRALIPVDGSATADLALDSLLETLDLEATLVLVSVVDSPSGLTTLKTPAGFHLGAGIAPDLLASLVAVERSAAESHLARSKGKLEKRGYRAVQVAVLEGEPGPEIVHAATDGSCDLIVMGTQGQSQNGSPALGSVAEYVVSHVRHIPVLVVPPDRVPGHIEARSPSMCQVREIELVQQDTAVRRGRAPVADIGPWLQQAYDDVARHLAQQRVSMVGPPFGRYHRVQEDVDEVEAGFPVARPITGDGNVVPSTLPGGRAATTLHIGPYDEMEPAYLAVADWLKDRGETGVGDAWEVYFSDPEQQPDPRTWRTEIVQPFAEVRVEKDTSDRRVPADLGS